MLIDNQFGFLLAGQASSASDIHAAIESYAPDLILWDLGWVEEPPFQLIEDLLERTIAIVALLADETHAADLLNLGVPGVLLADVDPDSLAATITAVAQGLIVIDGELRSVLETAQDAPIDNLVEALTARELQVLQLLAEGLPNKSIAKKLSISEHTVKFHVNAILRKLDVQSRTEAVVRASRQGLIVL